MTPRRTTAPPWFHLTVAVTIAIVLRAWAVAHGAGDAAPGDGHQVSYAFLGFLIAIGELIWKGLEAAGRVTLEILQWTVANLSLVVAKIRNGLSALGSGLLQGLTRVWNFTRAIYDDVLKPAWGKFWGWFDKFTAWLDRTFRPVLTWLERLRDNLVSFWRTYVRPWLDLIDVTRRALRVLSSLGLTWARALDARLGAIEDAIERPFRFVLAQLNLVIDAVNRIMTLDGLIQRLALIGSLARDYEYAWRAIANPWRANFDPNSTGPLNDQIKPRTAAQIASDYGAYVKAGGGARATMYGDIAAAVRKDFGGV